MTTTREALSRSALEDPFQSAIIEAALLLRWRVHHVRRSDRAQQQGQVGWPDLALARRSRVMFIECKSQRGLPSADQVAWLHALSPCTDEPEGPCTEAHTLRAIDSRQRLLAFWARPSDLDAVVRLLR